jgi:hypothetical protein
MKLFLWDRLDKVSGNYHTEGGLVIIANSLEGAKILASSDEKIVIDREPTLTLNTDATEPQVFVFENAGCC